jgi:hypothetical protein
MTEMCSPGMNRPGPRRLEPAAAEVAGSEDADGRSGVDAVLVASPGPVPAGHRARSIDTADQVDSEPLLQPR